MTSANNTTKGEVMILREIFMKPRSFSSGTLCSLSTITVATYDIDNTNWGGLPGVSDTPNSMNEDSEYVWTSNS